MVAMMLVDSKAEDMLGKEWIFVVLDILLSSLATMVSLYLIPHFPL
jgi:hypothetical protein